MITNKEDFINYDKFYSKQEVEQLLKSKGFKEGDFKITKLNQALKLYNVELFNNLVRRDKYNNNATAILKEFVDTANWEYCKRLVDSNSKSIYSKFVKNHFDKSIDYDKFYTKRELFQILEKKGFNNCRSVFIGLRDSLINYSDELASNVLKKESKDGYLILKEFVDTADWEFLKSLIEAKSKNVYYLFLQNHFDNSIDYNKFYTRQEFNQILKNNDFIINNDAKDINYFCFKDCIENYNKELIDKLFIEGSAGQQYLILKEFVNGMNWDFFKILYKEKTRKMNFWRIIVENHFEGYIPSNVATAILGYNYRRNKVINEVAQEDNDIFTTIEKDGITKIKTEDVMKWLKFKDSTIRLSEIYQSVVDEIDAKTKYKLDKGFYYRTKMNLIDDGFFDKYNPVNQNDTPFRILYITNDMFINIKYKNEIEELIKYQVSDRLVQVYGSKKDKFNHRLNQIAQKNKKVTLNEFYRII